MSSIEKVQTFTLQKQKYLGALIGNDNFWKTHGLGCGWDNLGKLGGDEGSGLTVVSGDDMLDLLDPEPSPSSCVVPYMVVETVHAAVYMFVAVSVCLVAIADPMSRLLLHSKVVSFFLCCCILVYPGKRRRVSDYEDEEECKHCCGLKERERDPYIAAYCVSRWS